MRGVGPCTGSFEPACTVGKLRLRGLRGCSPYKLFHARHRAIDQSALGARQLQPLSTRCAWGCLRLSSLFPLPGPAPDRLVHSTHIAGEALTNQVNVPSRDDAAVEPSAGLEIRRLLGRVMHRVTASERRDHGRVAYPMLLRLQPVDAKTHAPLTEPIVVVGKNICQRGLGFYHQQPLPYRRAIVTLEDAAGCTASLLIDLSWCRFTHHGWYDSGGRFLRVLDSGEQTEQPATLPLCETRQSA